MVNDLINNSIKNFKKNNIKSIKDVYNSDKNLIDFSDKFKNIEKETKLFLRHKMYNNNEVMKKNSKGKNSQGYAVFKLVYIFWLISQI